MSDLKKFYKILDETTSGATASGSVASVPAAGSPFQKRVNEEEPKKPDVIEYGNWENSALATTSKLKKTREKPAKVVKSIYGEMVEAESQKTSAHDKPVEQYDPSKEFPGVKAFQKSKVKESKTISEMDKSAPQPGRDGKVSHSTYGSRDKKGSDYFKGKEAPGKAITAKQAEKDALDILKKQGVAEGFFDRFKKKSKSEPTRDPIDNNERKLISKYFPQNNANINWSNGEPVLPDSVKAHYGKGILTFYKRDGQLKVSIAWHRSEEDRANPRAIPLSHFDEVINSEHDLSNLKNLLDGKKQGVAEAAKWRDDDLEGKTWRSPDWDDGELSPSKIKIDRSGKDVDDSGDELTSRPGAWRGKADMAKRMTKKGVPTKSELGFQDNLKMRMRMKKKEGGLTGPKGVLPEQGVAKGEGKTQKYEMMMRNGQVKKFVAKDDTDAKRIAAGHGAKSVIRLKGGVPAGKVSEQGVAEEQGYDEVSPKSASYILRKMEQGVPMSSILDDFPELYRMMEIIAGEQGLHMDDDFEDIEASLYHDLEDLAQRDDLDEDVDEGNPVMNAIIGKIMRTRPDLLKHGLDKLQAAIRDVAEFVGHVDEIGSSDVSEWVKQVEQRLSNEMTDEGVVDTLKKVGKKVIDVIAPDDEALLKDLKKKAGLPDHGQRRGAVPNDEDRIIDVLGEQDLILNPASIGKNTIGLLSKPTRSDHEVEMAKSDIYQAGKNAAQIFGMIRNISEEEGLEGWVQEKIIKAADYLNTVREYLEGKYAVESMDGVSPSTRMFTSEEATTCSECGGVAYRDEKLAEEKDACYNKVKSRYKVWPSAYASGALVKCRKVGASNWGNKSKK